LVTNQNKKPLQLSVYRDFKIRYCAPDGKVIEPVDGNIEEVECISLE
jgi:hypothetical protein